MEFGFFDAKKSHFCEKIISGYTFLSKLVTTIFVIIAILVPGILNVLCDLQATTLITKGGAS